MLLLVVLQVGLVVRDRVLVTHAAREAARAAAVAGHDRSAAAQRGATRASDLAADHLHVTATPVDGGDAVEVHVVYRSSTEVPLVGLLVPDLDLEADATMRVEEAPGP
jgi:Flp pilus assembly protein TadG